MRMLLVAALGLLATAGVGWGTPELADPEAGVLELVTPPEAAPHLDLVDQVVSAASRNTLPSRTQACVHGSLLDGRPLRGCDAVETVPQGPRPRAVRALPERGR